jgi:hypothetical protein
MAMVTGTRLAPRATHDECPLERDDCLDDDFGCGAVKALTQEARVEGDNHAPFGQGAVARALETQAARKRQPPMTVHQQLDSREAMLPAFAMGARTLFPPR